MRRLPSGEVERTLLANERTFLAYVRTSFAMIIFGFAFVEFSKRSFSQDMGIAISAAGLGLLLVGFLVFIARRKMILRRK